MVEVEVISNQKRLLGLVISLVLGVALALTFLPSMAYVGKLVQNFLPTLFSEHPTWVEMALFVFVTAFMYVTLPLKARRFSGSFVSLKVLLPSFLPPVFIALVFGFVMRKFFFVQSLNFSQDFIWFVICIPLGEEFLFRGWLWAVFRSIFKGTFFTLTNPLPSEIIFTSLSFSLWHLQNLGKVSPSFLFFQLLYTFFTGIWLGYLRATTGKIAGPLLAHSLINLASSVPTFL